MRFRKIYQIPSKLLENRNETVSRKLRRKITLEDWLKIQEIALTCRIVYYAPRRTMRVIV